MLALHVRFAPLTALAISVALLFALPLLATPSRAASSSDVVIAQVYGGGGNTGAPYKHDYVVLFNRGSSTVDLSNSSIQYASATGNHWDVTLLWKSIAPGKYLLIEEASGSDCSGSPCGIDLPAPDIIGTIDIGAEQGKVALVADTAPLHCGVAQGDCFPNDNIRDLVGYGSTANNYKGLAPVGDLSNTSAAARIDGGCHDDEDNSADFAVANPEPINSMAPAHSCVGGTETSTATETAGPTASLTSTPTRTLTPSATPTTSSSAFVNEFLPQPASDWNGDGSVDANDEWIELYNAGGGSLDMSLWQLDDAEGGSPPFRIPLMTPLPPQGFAVFFRSETGIALNDSGDEVRLLEPDGTVADQTKYNSSHADQSYARYPDGGSPFRTDCAPSPGSTNCRLPGTPTPTPTVVKGAVVINEFLPHPVTDWNGDGVADSQDEWIELYNSSSQSVHLDGLKLDDAEGGSKPFELPPDTLLAPKRILVFYASQTKIRLNDDGDIVRLLYPDATVADQKQYTTTEPDGAYGRFPDGASQWETDCFPSPGTSNCSQRRPTPTPAYDLTSLAKVRTLPVGTKITVTGYVIANACQIDKVGHLLMISDGVAGIAVDLPGTRKAACSIPESESILVTGVIAEEHGLIEIHVTRDGDLVRHFGDDSSIAPRSIPAAAMAEEYESMLLAVQGEIVVSNHGSKVWLNDGGDLIEIMPVDWGDWSPRCLAHGSIVRMVGVGYHDNALTNANEGYQIRPRLSEDIAIVKQANVGSLTTGSRGVDVDEDLISQARSGPRGRILTIGGVVSLPPNVINPRDFWVQDSSGGIRVHLLGSLDDLPKLSLWQSVSVQGRIKIVSGEAQFRLSNANGLCLFNTSQPIEPRLLKTGEVNLFSEGALVRITGTIVRAKDREIYIDDGSGVVLIYVYASTRIDYKSLCAGSRVSITGVVSRHSGRAEILPRFPNDLQFDIRPDSTPTVSHAARIEAAAVAPASSPTHPGVVAMVPPATATATAFRPQVHLVAEPTPGPRTAVNEKPMSEVPPINDTVLTWLSVMFLMMALASGVIACAKYAAARGR